MNEITNKCTYTVIGVSRCGCHSVVKYLRERGHHVHFEDGDCYTLDPSTINKIEGKVIVVLRNPLDHHKSFERMYHKCPSKTPQERLPGLKHLNPIIVNIENFPTPYHITGRGKDQWS